MTWDEALDALEQYARDERRGVANDVQAPPFVPPPGPVPMRLKGRAEHVLRELHETEVALAAELARVGAELSWLTGPSRPAGAAAVDRTA